MIYDVREDKYEEITEIVFANEHNDEGTSQAYSVHKESGYVEIHDNLEFVIVDSKEHAQNLIKALEKAISLGWLE
jgi:hypothetical protein